LCRQRVPQVRGGIIGQLRAFAGHPLSVLWLMAGVAVSGGIIEWVLFDRSPWEGFGAVTAGVVQVVAACEGHTRLAIQVGTVRILL
jgi:hypothetical protein